MKIAIIGVGNVGTACAKAMLLRGSCHEIVMIDLDGNRAKAVANDLTHGAVLCPIVRIEAGNYDQLSDASVAVVTAGVNEKSGGAVDRSDPRGRLLLLPQNALIYNEIIPRLAEAAPRAIILVVTDPPDALAEVARRLSPASCVLSSGTFLDSLRFRVELGRRLECNPSSVNAQVIGEHGNSQVYVWSSANVGGERVLDMAKRRGWDCKAFRTAIQESVKFTNIGIIEGTGASQHGIGIVTARIVEAILRDEGLVEPIGSFQSRFGVTLSLPSVIARQGIREVIEPSLSEEEIEALARSAEAISMAVKSMH